MKPERQKDAQARWILKRDEAVCVCNPADPRHADRWQCITPEQLAAWKKATLPPWPAMLQDKKRQAALWLWHSQNVEARRLSGRTVTLAESDWLNAGAQGPPPGLDAWDDAAGMTELQKKMFE